MRIILCATNDIATDSRVKRIALSVMNLPAGVMLFGISLPTSLSLPTYSFGTHRINMVFKKSPLFYAEFNIRLFFSLLFAKADLLVANDLDSLPAVYLASRIKRVPVIYDSHEYFTELPELVNRRGVKKIWEKLESMLLPRIKYASTVSNSIAIEYKRKYGIHMTVVRNFPIRVEKLPLPTIMLKKGHEKIILYQGSLNRGRGLELAIEAMAYMEESLLVIAGSGYLENDLKRLANSTALKEKVKFLGRVPPEDLRQYTVQADLGISLEENLGLSYYYALPNKLFDYIQARVPVLVSDLPEMASIVNQYDIGMINRTKIPSELAQLFTDMLRNTDKRTHWKSNLEHASKELCWEKEEEKLMGIYRNALAMK